MQLYSKHRRTPLARWSPPRAPKCTGAHARTHSHAQLACLPPLPLAARTRFPMVPWRAAGGRRADGHRAAAALAARPA
eukprot:3278221-Pleurochrysis_carterae.AAC.1